MNNLPRNKQVEAISALCEGVSIRAAERLTSVNRGTIMELGVKAGVGCAKLHNAVMHDLRISRLELDEIWQYVGKKWTNLKETDPATVGDFYIFIALDAT